MAEQVSIVEAELNRRVVRNPVALMIELATDGLINQEREVLELDRGTFPVDLSRLLHWAFVSNGGRLALIPEDLDVDLDVEAEMNEFFDESLYDQIEPGIYVKKEVGDPKKDGFRIYRYRRWVLDAGHSQAVCLGKEVELVHHDRPVEETEVDRVYSRLTTKFNDLLLQYKQGEFEYGFEDFLTENLFDSNTFYEYVDRLLENGTAEFPKSLAGNGRRHFVSALLAVVMRRPLGESFAAKQVASEMRANGFPEAHDGRSTVGYVNPDLQGPGCVRLVDRPEGESGPLEYERSFD